MYCRICGSEKDLKFYPEKRQALCKHCAGDVPAKVGREEFYAAYFDAEDDCPEAIKREFYSDYLASTCTVQGYIEETVSFA